MIGCLFEITSEDAVIIASGLGVTIGKTIGDLLSDAKEMVSFCYRLRMVI